MTLIPVSSILATVQQTPIIFIEEITDSLDPGTYEPWDYYILPPGTSFEDIEYWGTSTDLVEYTFVDGGQNFFDFDDIFPFDLIRGNMVPGNLEDELLENDLYYSNHNFFPSISYPRAVRIASNKNPVFNKTELKPISLHMNYSTTFFAEDGVDYWGYVDSADPFYLDVTFSATNVRGTISFESAYPPTPGYFVGIPNNKMTYPIFPKNESLLEFTLSNLNGSSLVTLTPHLWTFPTWLPTLELNNLTTGKLNQGQPWYYNETTDQFTEPDSEFFSTRMFTLPLIKGKYYRFTAIFDMEDVKPGVTSSEPYRFLIGDHYDVISGFIDQDGMIIRARESENATLVLYSPGEANGQYFIFYQEVPSTEKTETSPLQLNTDITLEYDIFYTFSFNVPNMMAINWTNVANPFDLTFYIQGVLPDEWIPIIDENFFEPERGNLYGDSVGDIATDHEADPNWRYMPAGSYAIQLDKVNNIDYEIRFTTIPIQQPGTIQVNQDSLFAIELPIVRNRLNWVNLSTDDQIFPIQAVLYEWTFVGKYNEQIASRTFSGWFGNQNETITPGVWEAWNYNNSIINALLPTRNYEVPILMIRPYAAIQNITADPYDTFSASLTVNTNVATSQSTWDLRTLDTSSIPTLTGLTLDIPTDYLYSGQQFFIPVSAISSTTSFTINNAYTTGDNQLYGIPLTLDPYSIYNITVYLIGNYSTYDGVVIDQPFEFLNATFEDSQIFVHGGNLRDLEIFESYSEDFDDTSIWRSLLILTVSGTSYLYIDLARQGPGVPGKYNLTMQVVITKLNLPSIEFQLDTEYDPTVSNQEVFVEEFLVYEIIPPEMMEDTSVPSEFPFEVLLLIGGGGVVITGGAAAIVYFRRKRSGF